MGRKHLFSCLLAAVIIASGLAFALSAPPTVRGDTASSPWPMYQHDLGHTGRSPYSGPSAPCVEWTYATGDKINSSPATAPDGTIYVGSEDGNLYAINPDGTTKWVYPTGDKIWYCSPAVESDGTVYIGSFDGSLHAVNADGSPKWTYATGDRIGSSPTFGSLRS